MSSIYTLKQCQCSFTIASYQTSHITCSDGKIKFILELCQVYGKRTNTKQLVHENDHVAKSFSNVKHLLYLDLLSKICHTKIDP